MRDDLHWDPARACLDPTVLPKISFSTLTHINRAYVWLRTRRSAEVILHHRAEARVNPVQPFNLIVISSSHSSSPKTSVRVSLSVCLGRALSMPLLCPFFLFLSVAFTPPQSSKYLPCGVSSPVAETYTNAHI